MGPTPLTTQVAGDALTLVPAPPDAGGTIRVAMLPNPDGVGDNPYLQLLTAALRRRGVEVSEHTARRAALGAVDVVHLHWPEVSLLRPSRSRAFLAGSKLLFALGLARSRGVPVVWTSHNLGSHESAYRGLERAFWWLYCGLVTHVVSLSAAGVAQVRERHPRLRETPAFVTPHGDYRGEYPVVGREEARLRLGLPEAVTVLLFCGQLRPYKNALGLVAAVADMPDPEVRLLISGKCKDAALRAELEQAAAADPRVILEFGYLDNDALATRVAAADLVVAPYRQIFNSGTALLALSLDRPVLLPRTPVMAELAGATGEDWVLLYDGDLTGPLLAVAAESACGTRGRPDLGWADWDRIATETAAVYRAAAPQGS